MPQVYRYPRFGFQRPGTQHYERGGHAYGGFRGLGDGGAATPAAVAMIPEPQALQRGRGRGRGRVNPQAFAFAMADQARQAQANAIAAAALGNPFAYRAQHAAAVAMKTRAAEALTFSGYGVEPVTEFTTSFPEGGYPVIPEPGRGGGGRPAEHPGQGVGQGLAKVREWWATRTPGQKAATVGAGVGLAWAVGLL